MPGAPYCSRCGAPLQEPLPSQNLANGQAQSQVMRPHIVQPEEAAKPVTPKPLPMEADPRLAKFLKEEQDPVLVKQAYEKVAQLMTSGEEIVYLATNGRGGVGHTTECIIATNKRVLLYKKKVLGKIELDDCFWRDVRDAQIKESRNGMCMTFEAIQGWRLQVDNLPRAQAQRLFEVAVEHCERLRNRLESEGIHVVSAVTSEATPAVKIAPIQAEPQPAPVQLDQPAPQLPQYAQPQAPAMNIASNDAGSPAPTPQSVLSGILRAPREAVAPVEPLRQAAAFQAAPDLDGQPMVFHEQSTAPIAYPTSASSAGYVPVVPGAQMPTRPIETPITGGPASTPNLTPLAQTGSLNTQFLQGGGYSNGQVPYANGTAPNGYSAAPVQQPPYGQPPAPQQPTDSGSLMSGSLYGMHSSGQLPHINPPSGPLPAPAQYGAPDGMGYMGQQDPAYGNYPPAPKPQPAAAQGAASDDPFQKMRQLKSMLDAGFITPDEYEIKKSEILSRI